MTQSIGERTLPVMGAARISLLGPLTVDSGDVVLGPRDRVVLTALATHCGAAVSAERLADALWGEDPPASWNKVILGCVMRLRRALGVEAIETTPQGYRLAVRADEIDANRFEHLLGRGRQLLTLGESERAAFVLGEALALWRGRPLGDAERWEPSRIEATRLEELRLDAEEARIDASLQSGGYRDVLGEAQARVAEAPLRERRWALLALAQYQAGRQGEALRTLRQARTALATELGVDPGPELVALEQAILRQDPTLIADTARGEASAVCPYRGLVPFNVADADGFFGRDVEVGECLRRLAATNALAVVGASGCGKSSLLHAGVAAALQRDGRRVTIVTPGAHPMDALTSLPANGDAVLVVDQCEEAVSLCADPAEQARFFTALADHAARSPIVVAVRADRLGDLSAIPVFARLVERGLYLLGAMGENELRAAIEGPAHQAGLLPEPGLVDLLFREVEGEPGALPLLSHALRQTWERREGRTLTVAGYRASGGIRGAVAQSAEALYEGLAPEQRPLLRDLLLRLVAPSADGAPVRCPVPRRSLAIDANHKRLVELLVAARLVTSDGDNVELAHEALARAWPRLRGWLDDDVEGQRIFRHLVTAADAWDRMGRPDSELYRGVRVAQAAAYQHASHLLAEREMRHADLTPTERQFLDSSRRLARHEARATRVRRSLVIGVVVLLVAATVGGVLAVRQGERADSAAVEADARQAAALSLDTDDIPESLLLAVEAVRLDDSPDTRASLLAAASRNPALIGSAQSGEPIVAVDTSPSGDGLAVGNWESGTWFLDADTLQVVGHFAEVPSKLEYRPDGAQLALAVNTTTPFGTRVFDPRPLRLIDPATFEEERVQLGGLPAGQVEAWDLAYSGNGRFLAASLDHHDGGDIATILVWDVSVPERPVQTVEVEQVVGAVELSPDGDRLYVVTHEPSLDLYDVATGLLINSVSLADDLLLGSVSADNPSDALEVSPDGTTVAVQDAEDIVLLDTSTLAEQRRLPGHSGVVRTLQFSPDGTSLASGSGDRTTVVWNLADGAQGEVVRGHAGPVNGVTFSSDGATLYTTGASGLLVWDLDGDRRFVPRVVPFEPGGMAAYALPAPDGEAVVHFTDAWQNNQGASGMEFFDVAGGQVGDAFSVDRGAWSPEWRPPLADQLALASRDGIVQVWDWRRGEMVAERRVADGAIAGAGIAYSDDGSRILIGERSGIVVEVDAETLEPMSPAVDVGEPVGSVAAGAKDRSAVAMLDNGGYAVVDFVTGDVRKVDIVLNSSFGVVSPDGRHVVVGGVTGEVGIVDLSTGEWLRSPVAAHTASVYRVAYAPDGGTFVSSGWDGRVNLFDGRTGDLLATYVPGFAEGSTVVAFLTDGHTVMITRADGSVYTWDTALEYWFEFACTVAGRNLTEDEWRDAFGDRPYRESCPTE